MITLIKVMLSADQHCDHIDHGEVLDDHEDHRKDHDDHGKDHCDHRKDHNDQGIDQNDHGNLISMIMSKITVIIGDADLEIPYKGAKEMLLVDNVENKEFLRELLEAMYDELPVPKKRGSGK